MAEYAGNYDVPEKCIKDILSLIKPVEDDRNKRLSAIQELSDSVCSVASLRGAAVKPFGSFVSNLYSNSGDLDISVQLLNGSNFLISKKKQNVLREMMRALQIRGVPGYIQFIPQARIPVLQYVSKRFGVSCDISIDNYPGRIKSKIFYWISTLDERFGDMVLLIKEWAKSQNINDPKNGTLNSYSLCLLVLFHFQTCEPAILPPLKEIYDGNIGENIAEMTKYNEEHLDEICSANVAKFQLQNKEEQKNGSSLCHLLVTFFHKFSRIGHLSSEVISTYTGQFEQIKDNPNRMSKLYSLFVEDPVERPDNAARAVFVKGLERISSAFSDANRKFASLEHADRNDLLSMLCTPGVGSKLGVRVIANSYANTPQRSHQHARSMGRVERVVVKTSDNQHQHAGRGFTGNKQVHNPPQVFTAGHQTARSYQNHNGPQVFTTGRQASGSYQNHNRPQVFNAGRQASVPYQDHNHPQLFNAGHQSAGSYQNHNHQQVYNTWVPTSGPYQNHNHQQLYSTSPQTVGSYQSYNQPQGQQVYTTGLQTQGQYQNYNHQPFYGTGHQTEGSHQHQQRQRTPGRPSKLSAASARYEPVRGGLQNGPALDSRAQASSSTAQPTAPIYQNR